jgi:hypothetical protein
MIQVGYAVIQTAREGIQELDRVRIQQGITQMEISERADMPDTGRQYSRMYGGGDVKLSKFLRFARALGLDLMIVKREGGADGKGYE